MVMFHLQYPPERTALMAIRSGEEANRHCGIRPSVLTTNHLLRRNPRRRAHVADGEPGGREPGDPGVPREPLMRT